MIFKRKFKNWAKCSFQRHLKFDAQCNFKFHTKIKQILATRGFQEWWFKCIEMRNELVLHFLLVPFLHERRVALEQWLPLQNALHTRNVVPFAINEIWVTRESRASRSGEGRVLQRRFADVLARNRHSVGDKEKPFGVFVFSRTEECLNDAFCGIVVVDHVDEAVGRGRELRFARSNPETVWTSANIDWAIGVISNTWSRS